MKVAIALVLLATTGLADTITEYTSGGWAYTVVPGQSVTTGAGPGWNNLEFNWFDTSGNDLASATLFLLSQEYTGVPADLSSSTAGYIAESTSIVNGRYVFDSSVTIAANTQYWFYADDWVVQFVGSGPNNGTYAGGSLYGEQNNNPANPFEAWSTQDAQFRLSGDPVPEPGTLALFGFALLGYGVYRRRRKAS